MTAKPQPTVKGAGLTSLPDPPKRPDAMRQRRHIARADQVLRAHYHLRPDVLVSGEGYLCYEASQARTSPRPDCIVAFGLDIPAETIEDVANGYVISELGRPPDFVLEVASPSTGARDYREKREIYASLRVQEYWRFDGSGGRYHDAALAGDTLENGVYRRIPVERGADGIIRGHSAALRLGLHWQNRNLRFWNPLAGEYLQDIIELLYARDAADTRAAREQAARAAAEVRAARAEQRVRELEAELHGRNHPLS